MNALRGRSRSRLLRLLLALVAGTLVLTGCDFSVYKLPLPGGADLGSNPITITAKFHDVLDLVPKSSVKVDDISVGEITDIKLDGEIAVVTMKIRGDTNLPDDPMASIRQTSLLGEKFVSLEPPAGGGSGHLENGDVIPISSTGRNPEIEDVLGALSLLLSGGGVAQLKTIASEINQTLDGREDDARSVLTQIAMLTGQLNDHRGDIVNAIDSLNRLALSVRKQQGSIDAALADLPSALDSIDRQRGDLVKMLTSLDHLSGVGVRVIKESKESTFETLRQLEPTLTQLANSGNALVDSISTALTYPFVDEVVGRDPQVARNLRPGDYTNLSAEIDIDLTDLPDVPGLPCTTLQQIDDSLPIGQILNLPNLCDSAQHALDECVNHPSVKHCAGIPAGIVNALCGSLTVPIPILCSTKGTKPHHGNLPGLPGVPGIPGLPHLPGLPGSTGTSGNSGNSGNSGGLLNGGGLLGGSPRAPFPTDRAPRVVHGTTLRQMMKLYDPALVTLLTPEMVVS